MKEYTLFDDDLAFWRNNELWSQYFYKYSYYLHFLLSGGKTDEAMKQANEMYAFAKERNLDIGMGSALRSMAFVYDHLTQFDESLRCIREAIIILKKTGSKYVILDAYGFLTEKLRLTDRFDEAQDVLKEWAVALSMPNPNESYSDSLGILFNWTIEAALVNTLQSRFSEAEQYLHEAERLDSLAGYTEFVAYILADAWLDFYDQKGDYDKALEKIYTVENFFADDAMAHLGMLQKKAEIAEKAGKYELASDTWRDLYFHADSLQKVEIAAKIDELRTVYEVDKHILEKERNRSYMLLALSGCLLLAAKLNTNENYLRETLKKHYGNTIGEYITGLRLNYARELLAHQGEK